MDSSTHTHTMNLSPIPPHIFIQNEATWQKHLPKLQAEPALAIDLESNSMYVYREQICLIQISTPTQDFIIDPLTEPLDLRPLGEIIADTAVQKIFHAGEYDMILMQREHSWQMHNLFDTMWAARVLGYKRIGLANMLKDLFALELDKRYQRANWGQRPLSPDQLDYAQRDTHYLFNLRDMLTEELKAAGRWVEAQEIMAEHTAPDTPDLTFSPDDFWSIHGVRDLTRRQQAILKELAIYRNEEAHQRDMPLFKIIGNKTLLAIAKEQTRHLSQLQGLKGMSRGQIGRYGRGLIAAVRKGLKAPYPAYRKRNPRPSDDILNRYETLHQWRKNRGLERGVESDVIMSREAMWRIAREYPQTLTQMADLAVFGPWRLNAYAQDILDALATES